jgi:hypothetical protein
MSLKHWLLQRHFFVVVGIPLLVFFSLVIDGGFSDLMILVNESRTTATITAVRSSGRGRSSLYYSYKVGSRTYSGRGGPEHAAFTPPFAVGDTFEVRYSKLLPFFSTAGNPLTIFGQVAVGCLFLLWADFMVGRYGKTMKSNEPARKR